MHKMISLKICRKWLIRNEMMDVATLVFTRKNPKASGCFRRLSGKEETMTSIGWY